MKLVVPLNGEIHLADARLVRLAQFYGIQCQLLSLEKGIKNSADYLEAIVDDQNSCFVVNPPVIREWLAGDDFPTSLGSYLASRFAFILLYNLQGSSFDDSALTALSAGHLKSVHPVARPAFTYKIAADYAEICGSFSGLEFGPVNRANDYVLTGSPDSATVQSLISIGGEPFFASVRRERAEVFVLAGASIADLQATLGGSPVSDYFSQLLPPAMLLRYVFGAACWHPNQHRATLVIDDPLLRKNYGFLNYERLLGLMDKYNFHTSIAFIPYNHLRSSPEIARMFRERPDRYSICVHGNDHTGGEFAAKDIGLLNAMLQTAIRRVDIHHNKTGVKCDKVIVFPQGNFSVDAMRALQAHNFVAAVNTVQHPAGEPFNLSLGEVVQPAVLKYEGSPLFLRKYVREILSEDIAFNVFFGKPIFIVEHHEIFRDPERLTELVSGINKMVPQIRWSNLQSAVENSYLRRWVSENTCHVLAYSTCGRIENHSDAVVHCSVEWRNGNQVPSQEVLLDGKRCDDMAIEDSSVRAHFDLAPGTSRAFAIVHQNAPYSARSEFGFEWRAKAFVRRRFSEIRDNYLSKYPSLFSAAQAVRRELAKHGSR
jgi:hypothetical protein